MWLGAVSVDIHKKDREYKDFTLSDENVVRYLILYRHKIDIAYGANTNINIGEAGDMFDFNQELICLYASLDQTVDKIKLKERDVKFLHLVYEGNNISDVIEHHDFPRKTAYRTIDRIVSKIVAGNNEEWNKHLSKGDY